MEIVHVEHLEQTNLFQPKLLQKNNLQYQPRSLLETKDCQHMTNL